MDNQRVLDATLADNIAHRQMHRQFTQAQASNLQPVQSAAPATTGEPESDMGDILIDSPRTENHYHPPAPGRAFGWKHAAILAAALALGGAAGVLGLSGRPAPTAGVTTPQPPAAVPDKTTPATAPTQAWDAIYEVQQPDGSWKQVKREHLKP